MGWPFSRNKPDPKLAELLKPRAYTYRFTGHDETLAVRSQHVRDAQRARKFLRCLTKPR